MVNILHLCILGYLLCLLLTWLSYWRIDVVHKQPWCVVSVYLTYICSFLSVWIVVSFTVERFIIVMFPFHGRNILRTRNAKRVIACLTVVAFCIYSPITFTTGTVEMMGIRHCTSYMKYMDFLVIFTYIDTVITLVMPSITVIILNSLIGYFIYRAGLVFSRLASIQLQWIEKQHTALSSNRSSNTICTDISSGDRCSKERKTSIFSNKFRKASNQIMQRRRKDSLSSVQNRHMKSTKMLLIVSTVFLVMNLPAHAIRIQQVFLQMMEKSYRPSVNEEAISELVNLVYHSNFAINFFLYSLCSKNFRRCVKNNLRAFRKYFNSFMCCSQHVNSHCNLSPTGPAPEAPFVVEPVPKY